MVFHVSCICSFMSLESQFNFDLELSESVLAPNSDEESLCSTAELTTASGSVANCKRKERMNDDNLFGESLEMMCLLRLM